MFTSFKYWLHYLKLRAEKKEHLYFNPHHYAKPDIAATHFFKTITLACESNDIELVQHLLKSYPEFKNPEQLGMEPLKTAVRGNHLELVQVLINAGISPLTLPKNSTLLTCAIINYPEMTQLLLTLPFHKDQKESAFWEACARGHLDVVKVLKNDLQEISIRMFNESLSSAMRDGHLDVIKFLINDCSHPKLTEAGHMVISLNHPEVIDYLMPLYTTEQLIQYLNTPIDFDPYHDFFEGEQEMMTTNINHLKEIFTHEIFKRDTLKNHLLPAPKKPVL